MRPPEKEQKTGGDARYMIKENYFYEHLPFDELNPSYILHRQCTIDSAHSFAAHWHESIELLYLFEGECDVMIDTERFHMSRRDVVCVNSGRIHSISSAGFTQYSALIVSPEFLRECGFPAETMLKPFISYADDQTVADGIRLANREGKYCRPYWQSVQKAAVVSLLCHLYRSYAVGGSGKKPISAAGSNVVKESLTYIRAHYHEDVSTQELADRVGVTVNHLCACFKKVTGMSVKKYVNSMRCRDAEAMLFSGEYTVAEAGARCGFNNMPYFAKVYRSVVGVLPSDTLSEGKRTAG